jgi:hypothetical protein
VDEDIEDGGREREDVPGDEWEAQRELDGIRLLILASPSRRRDSGVSCSFSPLEYSLLK